MDEELGIPMWELAQKAPTRMTISQMLLAKKSALEQQLADVSAALDALRANPEIAKVVELISKATRHF